MVPGQDLDGFSVGMVVENEVFQKVQEVFLLADAPEHGFQGYAALVRLRQALPLVEEFVLAAQGAHLGLHAVGEHQKGVVVEQVGNCVQIVRVVVGVGVLHVHGGLFQLHKQQRNAVHKANDVRPPAVQLPVDFQLLDGQEIVLARVLEIDHRRPPGLSFPIRPLDRDGDAVPDQKILLLVDLQK